MNTGIPKGVLLSRKGGGAGKLGKGDPACESDQHWKGIGSRKS